MKNNEFFPRESLEHAFHFWWVIVLLTVLGGIAGWMIHFLRPPIYEATAVMTVNMDFQRRKLSQAEQDYAFNSAGAVGSSTAVKDQVIAEIQASANSVDLNQLPEQMFLERMQSVWEFHVRNRDPQTAVNLANLWAKVTCDVLNSALEHAIRADEIQNQIKTISSAPPVSGSSGSDPQIQARLQALSDELIQEQQLSQGVISIMKFSQTGAAVVPTKPVLYGLADLVLAGACIGFIISLWAVNSYKVFRRG
jgi:capsular polysaccharide biosynthesis protein